MSEQWKKAITSNLRFLKKNMAKPESVADTLYNDGIISGEMQADIMQYEGEPEKMADKMLAIMLRRGHKALPALHKAFLEENEELAERLEPYVKQLENELLDKESRCKPSEWPPKLEEQERMNKDKVQMTNIGLYKRLYLSKDVYPMKEKVRGRVLVINNYKFEGTTKSGNKLGYRDGSDKDGKDVEDLFKQLHFDVRVHENKTSEEMKGIAVSESKDPFYKTANCLICVIMSHGNKEGVFGSDCNIVTVKELSEPFESQNCAALNEKPKLFLMQACRGKDQEVSRIQQATDDLGKNTKDGGDDMASAVVAGISKLSVTDAEKSSSAEITGTPTVHHAADFLYAYATPSGYTAWRHMERGSWFIQAVVWIFKYHAHCQSINDMLTKVNDFVSSGMAKKDGQVRVTVSNFESYLRKSLYFFPGMFGDHPVKQ